MNPVEDAWTDAARQMLGPAPALDVATFVAGLDSPHHSPESRRAWINLFYRDMKAAAVRDAHALREAADQAFAHLRRSFVGTPPNVDMEDVWAAGRIEEAEAIIRAVFNAQGDPATAPDYLVAKDRSMADHDDRRSECPNCGEWRDSPAADCAACGYARAALSATEPAKGHVHSDWRGTGICGCGERL